MPDELRIEPSEPEQSTPPEPSTQPEPSARPEPSAPSERQRPPGGGAPEPAPFPPHAARQDDGGGSGTGGGDVRGGGAGNGDAGGGARAGAEGDGGGGTGGGSAEGDGSTAAGGGAEGDGSTAAGDSGAAALEEAVRQRDAHYERLLRVTAEFDNYRKRTERERRELIDQAAGDLLGDLLPVVDDLERALAADAGDGDAYRRGVEIIHKQLLDVMARRGVAPIEAAGADFDPTLHQAVVHEPSDSHRDGEVVEELRRGYTLRGRLLRASMVKVAKA